MNYWQLLLTLIWAFFVMVDLVHAQSYNPNLLPLGNKESYMGNAGAAGLDSPAAVYYNPAGLANVGREISFSGSAYLHFEFDSNPIVKLDGEDFNYKATGLMTIPTSLVTTYPRRSWTFAASVLIPDTFKVENRSSFTSTYGSQSQLDLLLNIERTDLYLGLTAAKKIGRNWNWGFSIFGIRHNEVELNISTIASDVNSIAVTSASRTSLNTYHLRFNSGIQYRSDSYRAGLSLFTSSIQVDKTGDFFVEYLGYSNGNRVNTSVNESGIEQVDFRYPFDLAFGQVIHFSDKFMWTFDIGYQFGMYFRKFPDGIAGNSQDYVVDNVDTFRFATGMEYNWSDWLSLYWGGFSNPGTSRQATSASDFLGVTLGAIHKSQHQETGFGFYYTEADQYTYNSAIGSNQQSRTFITGLLLTTSYKF